MMFRKIIVPKNTQLLLQIPKEFVGKQVEVIAFKIENAVAKGNSSRKLNRQKLEDYFSSLMFDVKNLKLSRDESNER